MQVHRGSSWINEAISSAQAPDALSLSPTIVELSLYFVTSCTTSTLITASARYFPRHCRCPIPNVKTWCFKQNALGIAQTWVERSKAYFFPWHVHKSLWLELYAVRSPNIWIGVNWTGVNYNRSLWVLMKLPMIDGVLYIWWDPMRRECLGLRRRLRHWKRYNCLVYWKRGPIYVPDMGFSLIASIIQQRKYVSFWW